MDEANTTGRPLVDGWRMARSPAGQWALPGALDARAQWLPAPVPGTVAQTLAAHGLWSFDHPAPLNGDDYWYHLQFRGVGAQRLHFEGLATIADVYLNGADILHSDSMFESHDIAVMLHGENDLHICFRALQPILDAPQKRARWRPKLIVPGSLRKVRTTLLGHMPTWCPPVECVGPWRGIYLCPTHALDLNRHTLHARLAGDVGTLSVWLDPAKNVDALELRLTCAGIDVPMIKDERGGWLGALAVPDVRPWWPHTHGTPALYPVAITGKGICRSLGSVGFRSTALDRSTDGKGFGLVINGVPVFCRGANWTPPDLVRLPGNRADLLPQLTRMQEAGMNMVRVPGTLYYESNDFYALCDELGIMVWQDFAFANFDYPVHDRTFTQSVAREAHGFLARTQASPALTVLCGGTEIFQQAAMLGLPPQQHADPVFDTLLAKIAGCYQSDVIYVPNSPSGGSLPFCPDTGISHYYGVSAYKRPLADARLANVRFAAECLCFANVPDGVPVELLPGRAEILHHDFAPRVDFDAGAEWFFEGVRNHYLALLYDVDPEKLRINHPAHYLDLSRAVSAEVIEHVFAEWRRPGSPTRGGLVWFLRDLWPGAGWGVLDFSGAPKAAYYGLKRAFAPVQVLLVDEGLNGLDVHLINETAQTMDATLELRSLAAGSVTVMAAERIISLPPRGTLSLPATDLWGGFFDTTYAYRFGPPAHDVTVASIVSAEGVTFAQAFHFPNGRGHARRDTGLTAVLVQQGAKCYLDLACTALAQSVCITDIAFEPQDNWFHLAPGKARRIALARRAAGTTRPLGHVRAVNDAVHVPYGDAS